MLYSPADSSSRWRVRRVQMALTAISPTMHGQNTAEHNMRTATSFKPYRAVRGPHYPSNHASPIYPMICMSRAPPWLHGRPGAT